MPEVRTYPPGFVSWAELASPDPGASRSFYRDLFGWYSYTLTADIGDYEVFTLGDVQGPPVAGMHPLVDEAQPQSWSIFFRSEDIPATLDAVDAAGGQEVMEPIDISSLGQMALCIDSQGVEFSLWTPYTFEGAAVVDEPNAMCWAQLAVPDVDEARRFYGHVFGWKAVDRTYYSTSYTDWKIGDLSVAGMLAASDLETAGRVPGWSPCFWVADCDASVRRAAELGAAVQVPPNDMEHGRIAAMTDPGGARLIVITPHGDLSRVKRAP